MSKSKKQSSFTKTEAQINRSIRMRLALKKTLTEIGGTNNPKDKIRAFCK